MKFRFVALAFGFLFSLPAFAGFDEGLLSYVRKDYAQALVEWLPLAEQGNAPAQHNLGVMYEKGQGVAKDEAKAVQWYTKAAEQGTAAAQFNLGVMYVNGRGVAKDGAKAVVWFTKAAEQGVAAAQFNLGQMYDFGHGVASDEGKAIQWYIEAAQQGDVSAQYSLGLIYEGAHRQDYRKAVKMFSLAAEQNHRYALSRLGWAYKNGRGVEQDLVVAHALYDLAAIAGDVGAIGALYPLARQLSPEQLQESKELSSAWKVGTPLPTKSKTGRASAP